MKTRIINTGEIVDVVDYNDSKVTVYRNDETEFLAQNEYSRDEVEFLPDTPEEVTIEGWVARDEDGFINLYNEKPIRDYADRSDVTYGFWDDADGHHLELPTTSFSSVTWNTEPQKVRITITPIEEN